MRRAYDHGARFAHVDALTVFKFNSAYRRNGYIEKPSREQARYTNRIEGERGFVYRELAAVSMTQVRSFFSPIDKALPQLPKAPNPLPAGWHVTQYRRIRGLEPTSDPPDTTQHAPPPGQASPRHRRIRGDISSADQQMIVVERQDRIGNQLFEYASVFAAAHRLGTDFVMADEELIELFLLGGRSRAAERTPQYPLVTINNEDYDEPEEVLGELRDNTHYRGWFQSERFFADVADEVRHAFRLRPEHEDSFFARFASLLVRPYVCCHVRATDYATFASGIVLPTSYYRASLARVAPDPGTPIVFVGDNLAEVRVEFAPVDSVRFEENDEAIDFQLLMHADAVVVSNSTFAWWAAWLNTRPGKRVFAPDTGSASTER